MRPWVVIGLIATVLVTGCAASASRTDVESTAPAQAVPGPSAVTAVPQGEAAGGAESLTATGEQGVLWVRFPPMKNARADDSLSNMLPLGDYEIMFTPLRPEGGDLAPGALQVLVLPGEVNGDYRHIMLAEALPGDRFLLYTLVLYPGAQTGGTSELWWLDPQARKSERILTGVSGGGSYLTVLHNERWLFWNQGHANVPTFDPLVKEARAILADLATGDTREIQLGGFNWAMQGRWEADGKLHFELEGEPGEQVFDPVSGLQ